jgi:PPM family protein phosphatase
MTCPALVLASLTDAGKVRSQNEDAVAADEEARFAVLADGMGGHRAGEIASRIAVDTISSSIRARLLTNEPLTVARAEAVITSEIAAANSAVLQAASSQDAYRGMGTTLVLAIWHHAGITYGHVGDSRLYVLRRGELQQLTRDHSIVQEQLERGAITVEQARHALNRNVLTRAVGIDPVVTADIRSTAIEAGDVFLLCSDGLTDMLRDSLIESILRSFADDARAAAKRLVAAANDAGGFDNISVVVGCIPTNADAP